MSTSTRWNLIGSRSADHALRRLPASQGRIRKGALSRFLEAAAQARTLERRCKRAKTRNATVQPDRIEQAIDEALGWIRRA